MRLNRETLDLVNGIAYIRNNYKFVRRNEGVRSER